MVVFVFLSLILGSCRAAETPHSSGAQPSGAEGENGGIGVDVLTVFVVMLIIGVATYHILAVTRIPYTAILILWGVWLGIANETYDASWKLLGVGTQAWQNIDPTLLLTAFLPVLLFAAAFGLEYQYIRRLMGSGLLLAGPGVLFGASLTAVLVKYTFPYSWSWVECLLFGAVFSATDPVAVVAVLKETGMPKKVRTLVDLEALLNDGTAYVLFVLLKAWAEGKHQTAGDAIKLFFQLTAGGPATGIAFGLAMTLWLRFIYNKPMAEISLTLAGAYGTYIVGDELFGVSPVLAVVFLGLWMAAKGFNHISRKVEHPLHVFWEELEFVANTVVFILSGIVIAGRIYESANSKEKYIQAQDWGYALLLWVYLTVIRILMFLLAWPFLNSWGYVLSPKEAVVLCWSGLRGAVGLSLALFILLDANIADARFRTLTFFHMGCVAFLTIIFQGTSMKPLLQWMQLTRPTRAKRAFMRHVLHQVEEHGDEMLTQARNDKVMGEPDWLAVQRLTDLQPKQLMRRYSSTLGSADIALHTSRLALKMNRNLLVRDQRSRLLLAVRQTYNDFFRDHYVSTRHVFQLRLSADEALDRPDRQLADWWRLRQACWVPSPICYAQRLTKSEGALAYLAQRLLAARLEDAAILALAFCHSHQLAAQDLVRYEKLEQWDEDEGSEEGAFPMGLPLDSMLLLLKHNTSEQILMESRQEVEQAFQFIKDLRDAFPEVMKGIKTGQLAQEMLIYKEEYIEEIGQTGLLDENEMEQLADLVECRLSRLHFEPPRFPWRSPAQLLAAHPLFQDLDEAVLRQQVLPHIQVRFFNEGSLLCRAGDRLDHLTLILRGKARLLQPGADAVAADASHASGKGLHEKSPGQDRTAPAGTVLGYWSLLQKQSCPYDVPTASACLVARLPHSVLQPFLARNPAALEAAWQSLGATLALGDYHSLLMGYSYEQLLNIFRRARLDSKDAGMRVRVAGAAMLVAGRMRATHEQEGEADTATAEAPCLLPVQPAVYFCLSPVKVLHLPASLGLAAGKGDTELSKSAQAVLVQARPSRRPRGVDLSRVSAPMLTGETEDAAAADESAQPNGLEPVSPDASLSVNRRKSLAHGLALHNLASRSSGPLQQRITDSGSKAEHAKTLSGATGKMLQREWQAYRRRQQQEAASLPLPASGNERPRLGADTFVAPDSEDPPEERAVPRSSSNSMPAKRQPTADQAPNGDTGAVAARTTESSQQDVAAGRQGEGEDAVATELPLRRQVLRRIGRSSSSTHLHRANLRRPSFLADHGDGLDTGDDVPEPAAEP